MTLIEKLISALLKESNLFNRDCANLVDELGLVHINHSFRSISFGKEIKKSLTFEEILTWIRHRQHDEVCRTLYEGYLNGLRKLVDPVEITPDSDNGITTDSVGKNDSRCNCPLCN